MNGRPSPHARNRTHMTHVAVSRTPGGPRAHAATPGVVVEQYLERLGSRHCEETTRN